MARRLKATGNYKMVIRGNQPINAYEILSKTKDEYYQNDLVVKTEALERLSGVKNSSQTYYGELKKSMAEMKKCNLFLTESQNEIANLYQLLKKKAEQTLAILEVSRAVSYILPFDQILQKTNDLVSKVLGPVECYLFEIIKKDPVSLKPYVSGADPQYYAFINNQIGNKKLWNSLIRGKKPIRYKNDEGEFLAIPLVSRGDLNGVLTIKRAVNKYFTPEEIELCVGIANPVAVAIENRTLVEKLEAESLRLKTALLSLKITSDNLAMLDKGVEPILQAIGESLLKITEAEYGVILSRTYRLVSLHIPKKLKKTEALDAYLTRWLDQIKMDEFSCPYGVRKLDLQNDPNLEFLSDLYSFKEAVVFPMINRDKILGLILLFFRQYKSDDRCQSILQVLGNQTAIVLENAELFEDTIRLKDEAEAHYKVVCAQKEQLEQKNQELKKMYNILFHTREEQIITQERNRIAADLHDNVLQILFAIGLNFEWCLKELTTESPVYSKIIYLDQLVNKAVKEIREVVSEFSSMETSVSLRDSIETLAQDLNKAGSVSIKVQAIGNLPSLPSMMRNISFRIVQEALVNALRHSGATTIDIELLYANEKLQISINDNGVGIYDNIMENLHEDDCRFGLKNMIQRAKYVNGTLQINKLNSGGTGILVEIPI